MSAAGLSRIAAGRNWRPRPSVCGSLLRLVEPKAGNTIVAAVLALVFASSAAAASFEAQRQRRAGLRHGLPAGAQVSLLDSAGTGRRDRERQRPRRASLFRERHARERLPRPPQRRRARPPAPLTVLTTQSAPPDDRTSTTRTIPSDGYGYMTTRDGTKLAYSVHPPTDVLNALGRHRPAEPDPIADRRPRRRR